MLSTPKNAQLDPAKTFAKWYIIAAAWPRLRPSLSKHSSNGIQRARFGPKPWPFTPSWPMADTPPAPFQVPFNGRVASKTPAVLQTSMRSTWRSSKDGSKMLICVGNGHIASRMGACRVLMFGNGISRSVRCGSMPTFTSAMQTLCAMPAFSISADTPNINVAAFSGFRRSSSPPRPTLGLSFQ